MMLARQSYAHGPQNEYFDEPDCIGFTRHGDPDVSSHDGLAVIMTSRFDVGTKRMFVGKLHAGEIWTDLLDNVHSIVEIDSAGWAEFAAAPRGISVWVNCQAAGRSEIDRFEL